MTASPALPGAMEIALLPAGLFPVRRPRFEMRRDHWPPLPAEPN